ncbi:MAG: DNA repair protein RadA [Chitinophagaceae bacterium]|nr:DNA repair protein RadA [Chitinophagaceae bacterium]
MSKNKTTFICQQCGTESAKWQGKCPSCNSWNTFVEEIIHKDNKKEIWEDEQSDSKNTRSKKLGEIVESETVRIRTKDNELNRVLGGGIVEGSVILVAGEPGIGKSTLFLQACLQMNTITTLYISGEESLQQIKMRADRLKIANDNFYLLTSTDTQTIFNEIKKIRPQLVVIDSIQTLESQFIESAPGSVSQVRECTAEIVRFAKATNTPVFIIGHITKDGNIAGPKVLEHMVDTVLQFEGDRHYAYRILRTTKNRFGNGSELGIYEMSEGGLKQISNPSDILITQKDDQLSGVAIAAMMEGARPLLIETQALVTHAVYGTPQRTVTGYDLRRLQLLLAVLEKRGGFHFGVKDVFLNMAGGIKVEDPAIDLAVICALLSSYEDKPIPMSICFVGEVGLSGEVRAVSRIEQRIAEAEKLGFEKIVVSKFNKKSISSSFKIQISFVSTIEELYNTLF